MQKRGESNVKRAEDGGMREEDAEEGGTMAGSRRGISGVSQVRRKMLSQRSPPQIESFSRRKDSSKSFSTLITNFVMPFSPAQIGKSQLKRRF